MRLEKLYRLEEMLNEFEKKTARRAWTPGRFLYYYFQKFPFNFT